MSLDRSKIHRRLEQLRELDSEFKLFGSNKHQYILQPTVSISEVEQYEKRLKISLPDDYRKFLITVGNGGAGPFYGVIGIPGNEEFCDEPTAPFKYRKHTVDTSNTINELYELEESAQDYDARYEELILRYWTEMNSDGAIYICDYGCALRFYLALNGQERGHIWFNATPDQNGFSPVGIAAPALSRQARWYILNQDIQQRVTFTEWYNAWLDGAFLFLESEIKK